MLKDSDIIWKEVKEAKYESEDDLYKQQAHKENKQYLADVTLKIIKKLQEFIEWKSFEYLG